MIAFQAHIVLAKYRPTHYRGIVDIEDIFPGRLIARTSSMSPAGPKRRKVSIVSKINYKGSCIVNTFGGAIFTVFGKCQKL